MEYGVLNIIQIGEKLLKKLRILIFLRSNLVIGQVLIFAAKRSELI